MLTEPVRKDFEKIGSHSRQSLRIKKQETNAHFASQKKKKTAQPS